MYAVHPGYVVSITDGQRHFIDARHLVGLYGLRDGEFMVMPDGVPFGRMSGDSEDFIHLYPQTSPDSYAAAAQIIDARRHGSHLDIPAMYSGRPPSTPNIDAHMEAIRRGINEGLCVPQGIYDQGNYSSARADADVFTRRLQDPNAEREFQAAYQGTFAPTTSRVTADQIRRTIEFLRSNTLPRTTVDSVARTITHVEGKLDRVVWVLHYPPGESHQAGRVVSNAQLACDLLVALMSSEDQHGVAMPEGWNLIRLGPEVKRRKITRGKKTIVRRRIQSTGEL